MYSFEFYFVFDFICWIRQQCGEGPGRPSVTNQSEDLLPSRGESLPMSHSHVTKIIISVMHLLKHNKWKT